MVEALVATKAAWVVTRVGWAEEMIPMVVAVVVWVAEMTATVEVVVWVVVVVVVWVVWVVVEVWAAVSKSLEQPLNSPHLNDGTTSVIQTRAALVVDSNLEWAVMISPVVTWVVVVVVTAAVRANRAAAM